MKWLLPMLLATLVVGLVMGTVTGQGSGNGNLQISQENNTMVNMTVPKGKTTILPCRVPLGLNESNALVSWVRRRDWHILSVGIATFTNDERFSVLHPKDSQEWKLMIKFTQKSDEATYECQISDSSGLVSKFVNLKVVEPRAYILGNHSNYNIEAGSTIKIECVIQGGLTRPAYIFWYVNDRMINYDTERGGISVSVNQENDTYTSSVLYIAEARMEDNGNYTCQSPDALPASVNVVVSEAPQSSSNIPVVSLTLGSSLNPDGIEQGDDVYFECELTGGYPGLASFYHNRRQLTSRDQGISVNNEKLVIQQVNHDQAGNYYCKFDTNEGIFKSNTVSLKIQDTDRTFDINDKTPYFINRPLPMQTVVALDAAPNTTVFTLQARDPDKDHDIHYWLVRDRTGGRFEVDENTGEVRTRGYERFQPDMEYVLYVKAEDQNGRVNVSRQRFQLTGDERVAIRKTTSGEEYQSTGEQRLSIVGGKRPPQFYLTEYEKTIPANLAKGKNIITVAAKSFGDREIHYSLAVSGQGNGTFSIGPTSGIVKLAKELDFMDPSQPHIYQTVVKATEETGGYFTPVDLTIKVSDVDEAIEGTDEDRYSLRCPSDHNTTALLEELKQLRRELQHSRQQNGC